MAPGPAALPAATGLRVPSLTSANTKVTFACINSIGTLSVPSTPNCEIHNAALYFEYSGSWNFLLLRQETAPQRRDDPDSAAARHRGHRISPAPAAPIVEELITDPKSDSAYCLCRLVLRSVQYACFHASTEMLCCVTLFRLPWNCTGCYSSISASFMARS